MLENFLRFITRVFSWVGILGVAAMALHVTADVACKTFFNMPLPATIDMTSNYYMVAIVFFPLAAVELKNRHISVEIVSQHLPRRGQEILVAIVSIVGSVYFAILTMRTWGDAVRSFNIGEYLLGTAQLTIWPTRFFVPLGCGLLSVILIWKAIMLFRRHGRLMDEGATTIDME